MLKNSAFRGADNWISFAVSHNENADGDETPSEGVESTGIYGPHHGLPFPSNALRANNPCAYYVALILPFVSPKDLDGHRQLHGSMSSLFYSSRCG